MIAGTPKNPNIATRKFFNAIHLLPEDLRFENDGAELASCPGRYLTSFGQLPQTAPSLDPPLVSILSLRSSVLLQLKYLRGVFQLDVENIANVIAFYHCSSLMFVGHHWFSFNKQISLSYDRINWNRLKQWFS